MQTCGCKAFPVNNRTVIEYCPLHQSAPALLAALEKIAAGNPPEKPGGWLSDVEMAGIARAAIAAARGDDASEVPTG